MVCGRSTRIEPTKDKIEIAANPIPKTITSNSSPVIPDYNAPPRPAKTMEERRAKAARILGKAFRRALGGCLSVRFVDATMEGHEVKAMLSGSGPIFGTQQSSSTAPPQRSCETQAEPVTSRSVIDTIAMGCVIRRVQWDDEGKEERSRSISNSNATSSRAGWLRS